MVEGTNEFYTLRNVYGRSNCTLTALFPAVVSIKSMKVGNYFQEEKNYDVPKPKSIYFLLNNLIIFFFKMKTVRTIRSS